MVLLPAGTRTPHLGISPFHLLPFEFPTTLGLVLLDLFYIPLACNYHVHWLNFGLTSFRKILHLSALLTF